MHGRHHAVYTLTDALKQGTNATIEIIQRELVKLEKDGNTQTHSDTDIGPPPPSHYLFSFSLQLYASQGKPLPRKLYLQLDNTSKQNKSKYMLGYLGSLV